MTFTPHDRMTIVRQANTASLITSFLTDDRIEFWKFTEDGRWASVPVTLEFLRDSAFDPMDYIADTLDRQLADLLPDIAAVFGVPVIEE